MVLFAQFLAIIRKPKPCEMEAPIWPEVLDFSTQLVFIPEVASEMSNVILWARQVSRRYRRRETPPQKARASGDQNAGHGWKSGQDISFAEITSG